MSDTKDGSTSAPSTERVRTLLRPAFAEFVASALFIYASCGCGINAAANYNFPDVQILAIAVSFGFNIFVLAFMIGHISGGHINAVVTVSFMLLRKITILRGVMYIMAQFFGMLVGALVLQWTTPSQNYGCFASNFVSPDITPGEAFLSEIILTGVLLMTVCAATDSAKADQTLVPLAIGVAVMICHLMSLPITGTSLNPTRSFASAALASNLAQCSWVWTNHWIFWFGPFMGGISGALLYDYCFHDGGNKFVNLVSMYRNIW